MNISELLLLAAIGFSGGIISGMFGVGGGIIIVPTLVFFMGMGQHTAQGTSLGVLVLPVVFLAAYNYYKSGNLDVKYGLVIALTFLVGGYFGSKISLGMGDLMLKRIFGILMIVGAVKLIFFSK
ncbi:MAG: permease [Flavobacteriales bacterium]|nr:sulfite exporter TauE/SafE family protein [Bacteroidales bacterium AH-315-I05]PCJ90039.1 MAG: permease [Flavobacteriales bacterium]